MVLLLPKVNKRVPIFDKDMPAFRPLHQGETLIVPYILIGREVTSGFDLKHYQQGDLQLGFSICNVMTAEDEGYIQLYHEVL